MIVLAEADPMGVLMLYGFVGLLLDFLIWGSAGYLFLRALGLTDRHWPVGGLAISVAYLLIEQLLGGQAAAALLAQGEAQELFAFGIGDVVTSLLMGYGGFAVGGVVFRAAARKAAEAQGHGSGDPRS